MLVLLLVHTYRTVPSIQYPVSIRCISTAPTTTVLLNIMVERKTGLALCGVITLLLLLVILLPMSFAYIDYWEYGLKQRKSTGEYNKKCQNFISQRGHPHLNHSYMFCAFCYMTLPGKVSTDRVYVQGRYAVGPDYTFLKYQADAHLEHLENVAVFSDGGADSVGLSFLIDVDFTYFLKEDEIGELHKDLAK